MFFISDRFVESELYKDILNTSVSFLCSIRLVTPWSEDREELQRLLAERLLDVCEKMS